LRAARIIEQADIVFHDALVHPQTVAMAARAEKIAVGKRCGRHSAAQHFINKRLIDAARKHRTVVRLKGGDPMVFGRSQEEIDALTAAGVPVEIVPGVTAALAAAAQLRVSLTRRGSSRSVTIVTPRVGSGTPQHDWTSALSGADTVAIYMGAGEAEHVQQSLRARGYAADTPVALCESVSLPESRSLRGRLEELPTLAARLTGGPAVILVGKVFATPASAHIADACHAPEYEAARAQAIARSAR
jgi:uroporphyrin-III C-methyltransferase